MLKKYVKSGEAGSILFLVILILTVGFINPSFLNPDILLNCLNDSVVFILLAAGSAFVIFTGEIDVSVGAVLGMSAAIGASILRDSGNVFMAVFAALLAGVIIGAINGFGIAYLNIPSLIFTLGINGITRGCIYVYTKGAWVENLPAYYTKAANIKLVGELGIFFTSVLFVLITINILLLKTKKGVYFKAVGDNALGAKLVGIPTKKTKMLAYILCGSFAAVAGLIYTSRIGFVTPSAGNGYEMKAIAACVIGGIALSGGQGNITGAATGAIIMSSIGRILVFLGLSSDYDNTITGTMLIVIVVLTSVIQKRTLINSRHEVLLAKTAGKEIRQTKEISKGGRGDA